MDNSSSERKENIKMSFIFYPERERDKIIVSLKEKGLIPKRKLPLSLEGEDGRGGKLQFEIIPSPSLSQRERDKFVVSPKGRGISLHCSPKGRGIKL